jgi:branched-chain amino acid transport system ATP-binding protein
MAGTILTLSHVTKRFGGLVAVDGMTFSVQRGSIQGLIGPNGSGKSTTLNLMSGALRLSEGEIILGNQKISGRSAHSIAKLGVARTFQLVRLLPSLTVAENIRVGGLYGHVRHSGKDADRAVDSILERVGLGGKGRMMPGQLTYIDTKRVELGRALIAQPRVLLLDEWLAGLNPTELEDGIELIQSLRDECEAIVIVEHVMEAIRSLCDSCVVMASGAKIAEGSVQDVLSAPQVIEAYLGGDDD